MHRLVVAMREALAAPGGPQRATCFRDYLFVAVAVSTALRSRNLREMRCGLNLVQRKIGWEIIYDGSEVKNGEAILGRLPPVLDPFIEWYMKVERPHRLMKHGRTTDMVWVSALGGAIAPSTIWFIFHRVGIAMLGYPINPHSTRHVAVTRILDDDPRALNTAALALGHKELRTACEFYDQSGPRASQAVWLSLLNDIRSEADRTRAHRASRNA
jgi:integrase